jgi:transposase
MMIIGCDFHPSWQQVSWVDLETGETGEGKLGHGSGEAQRFYQQLEAPVLIGMEATGNSQWFIELVEDMGHEIWIGDAAQIRASYVRKQKTDKRDAAHLRKLAVEGRFPRLWMPDRHKLVMIRSRVKNELQHLALNKGMQRKAKLWSQAGQKLLRELPLKPWAACRREDLLGLLAMLQQQIGQLDAAVQRAAEENPQARLLMTQPGVGPNTALAYVLTIGEVSRFRRGKQVASYLGLIPQEHSSGDRRRTGAISKQGNRMLRSLLVEAAQTAVQHDPGMRKQYLHRCHQKAKAVAKVAAARKLAVRLYWMLRTQTAYPEIVRIEGSPGLSLVGAS